MATPPHPLPFLLLSPLLFGPAAGVEEALPPAFPPLLCSKYGLVCTDQPPTDDVVPNPIPAEFTAEMVVEKNGAADGSTTMEARTTLYRFTNSSLTEGMITYKWSGGSVTMPSTSYSSVQENGVIFTIGETESGELNCTKKIAQQKPTQCVLQYLGIKFVHEHLTDAFYCRNEDSPGLSSIYYQNIYTGLPQAHVASPGLQNETSVVYTKFTTGTPLKTHNYLPKRVLDVCTVAAIMGKNVSFIGDSGRSERLRLTAGFPLDAFLLPHIPVKILEDM